MRLRHIPGAEQMIEETPHVVHGAKEKKEKLAADFWK